MELPRVDTDLGPGRQVAAEQTVEYEVCVRADLLVLDDPALAGAGLPRPGRASRRPVAPSPAEA